MKVAIGTVVMVTFTKEGEKRTSFGIVSGITRSMSEPGTIYQVDVDGMTTGFKIEELYPLLQGDGHSGLKRFLNEHGDTIILSLVREIRELRSELEKNGDGADSFLDRIGM